QLLTLFTSSLYLAALVTSIGASFVSKKHGRKLTMFLGGLFFLIGAVLNAAAVHISMLILGRFFLGLGVGFANQSVPIYLSEIAPYKYRGTFNVLFQLAITLGILTVNIVNFLTNKIPGGWGWRVSLGGAAYPSSLIDRGNTEEAEQLLKKIRGIDNVKAEFKDLVEATEASKKVKGPWKNLVTVQKYRPQLILSALIPTFQQLTGINVVMFYAPVLFKTLGFKANASLMSAVITGAVNVGATFISVYCTDSTMRHRLNEHASLVRGGTSFLEDVVLYEVRVVHLLRGTLSYFYVPETKNIPIEEMSQVWREHWYWKKFVDDDDAEIKPRVKPATDIV
ncbi:Sugar transport protein 1, partial [Capsicum annuum]